MKVSVVILNFKGYQDTRECLATLFRTSRTDFDLDVVVVDNASADESVAKLREEFTEVTILVNSENLGFAQGNNVGIRYALKRGADFIFVLNNDTLVAPETLGQLVTAAHVHKKGGIFGPKIYFAKGYETHHERYKKQDLGKVVWYAGGKIDWDNMFASHRGVDEVDTGDFSETLRTTFVTGCAMFVRREVFEKVGLFDTKLFLYFDDVDFCIRVRRRGFELFFVPDAIIWHKNARGSGGTGSDLQSYYLTRNRLLIGMRYAPWRTKLALFREAVNLLMHGTRTERQAVGDFLRKKYNQRGKTWKFPTINLFTFFGGKPPS